MPPQRGLFHWQRITPLTQTDEKRRQLKPVGSARLLLFIFIVTALFTD